MSISNVGTGLLVVLAVVQAVFLMSRSPADAAPTYVEAPPVSVGDSIGVIEGVTSDRGPVVLPLADPDGRWTAVLAFNSTCSWCDKAAEDWREWLSVPRSIRTVAVTRDSLEQAVAYADGHGWSVDLVAMPNFKRGSIEHQLVSRTPWVFLFDPSGRLRYEGNGARLDVIEELAG